ncbi:hypothetical protein GQ55_8G175100 [Panicum hallii var. hallii]|uniref:Uncharacterized protein n=1 Tax=Panicum hallii var. hallii TaxID=1504633 RepID=A0A2T7CNJ2_9POAL|nr:hypothetical protein GQ55_8G175100 [Panicum hallii var. hallii]
MSEAAPIPPPRRPASRRARNRGAAGTPHPRRRGSPGRGARAAGARVGSGEKMTSVGSYSQRCQGRQLLPRALVQRLMQQSASATAPGGPVAVDTEDVQQLLEEMPLRLVHFLISQVGNKTCTLTCIANCPEHLY